MSGSEQSPQVAAVVHRDLDGLLEDVEGAAKM